MESTASPDIDFQKLWLVLRRRWLLGTGVFIVIVGLTVPLALLQKPDYEATGKLLFKPNRTPSLTGVGRDVGELAPLSATGNPISTEIEIINSVPLTQATIEALNLRNEEGELLKPETFQKKLKVKNIGSTDVVELSYKSADPKQAATAINKLMNLYLENNLRTNRAEIVAAQKFIAQQLPKAEANVNQAEAALREFKEENQVIALDEEATSAVKVMAGLDQEITEAEAELTKANARLAELRSKVGVNSEAATDISSINQSSGVQNALAELQKVQSELADRLTRFSEEHPTVIRLRSHEVALKDLLQERVRETIGSQTQVSDQNLQIGELKQNLIEEFVKSEVERLGLANRVGFLSNARLNYQQRLETLPKLEQTQRELERRLKAAQSTYETLLTRYQEVRVAENQNIGNARIIEPAVVPDKRSRRQQLIILFLGIVAGTLLSMTTIITLEVRDTSLKTLKEVRDLFGYTLLASIPAFGKKTRSRAKHQEPTIPELPVRDTPRSPLSEAYRMLQANLKFLSSDKPPKVIVVTSSVPKEGKSTVSANLATAMAQLGRRVLLVDADLRHPMQHHIWELTNAAGLSDVLVGQAEFKAVVKQVMDNLDVLSSGVIPPNPLALLDSKRMASLIESFSKDYDFVILDAPPLVVAADALTLGKMTDGVLLVARPKVIDSTSAVASKELLERSNQNVLGLVINGVIVENEPDSYFYYAKGYFAEEEFNLSPNNSLPSAKN